MPPPPMTLFDPEEQRPKVRGTPDYLAPETIAGNGQDEVSDWWSLGCILFESSYGYPPFHADTPDEVFQNILARRIDWPEDDDQFDWQTTRTIDTLAAEKFGATHSSLTSTGTLFETIKHPSFRTENPEDPEYFDPRGAAMANFSPEFQDEATTPAGTPITDYPDRPHDALSRVRSQVTAVDYEAWADPSTHSQHTFERAGHGGSVNQWQTDDFGNILVTRIYLSWKR
ncbi:unnamed protein product [Alternaria alternata]